MQRRNARLRREYLYRKSLQGKEQELYEKKRKIQKCLEGMFYCSRYYTKGYMVSCKQPEEGT